MELAELRAKIRDIKDFPTEGVLFKDITTLLKDGPAFRSVVDYLAGRYQGERVDVVVGLESRGLIFGGAPRSRSTRPRAGRASACSPWTTCSRPAARWRRRSASSSSSAGTSSASRS